MGKYYGNWYAQNLGEAIEEFDALQEAHPDWETLSKEEVQKFLDGYRKEKEVEHEEDQSDQDQ